MALAVIGKCLRAARKAASKEGSAAKGGRRLSSTETLREPDFRPSQIGVVPSRRSIQVITQL